MESLGARNSCPRCMELQRSFLKTLEEKRTLLLKVQSEQERSRKLQRELDCLKTRRESEFCRNSEERKILEQSSDVSSTEVEEIRGCQLTEVMQVNRKWKDDYEQLQKKHEEENSKKKDQLEKTQAKLAETEIHVLALESELIRLATALSSIEQNTSETSTQYISQEDIEVIKQQMLVYKEDFTKERQDREKMMCERDCLQEQLQNCQELVAALNQELGIYKDQYQKSQEENRLNTSRRHSVPVRNSSTQPQLQLVYPVVSPLQPQQQQQQWQWRQEQRRRGIFTRGPTPAPPSVFYGGDVEVDKEPHNVDIYRTY